METWKELSELYEILLSISRMPYGKERKASSIRLCLGVHKGREWNGMIIREWKGTEWNVFKQEKGMEKNEMEWN